MAGRWLQKYVDNPPGRKTALPQANEANKYETAEEVIRAIYNNTFKGACLIPVKPAYREIFGTACWICGSERQALRKRMTEAELVFTVDEFKLIVDEALHGKEVLQAIIEQKKAFGGVIGIA